jgi:hypothetical protein
MMPSVHLDPDSFWTIVIWVAFVGVMVAIAVIWVVEYSADRIIAAIEQLKRDHP